MKLDRRRFLGGAGAILALPLLESLPARAETGDGPPQRLITYFAPNGLYMPEFTPTSTGAGYALTPTLEPLQEFVSRVLVITGLDSVPGEPEEGGGDHAAGTGAFLTGRHVKRTEGQDLKNGISLDQVIANHIGADTRFPSVQLGLEGGSSVGGCDFGYSCAYLRNISWADGATPLPKMINPQLVFDRFFGGSDSSATVEQIALRRTRRLSVLDYVLGEANRLRDRIGASDRIKLDGYLDSVRQVELQIGALADAPICEAPGYPAPNLDTETHTQIMADLIAIALQCDLTRVVSFMLANGFSERHYAFLGVSEGHHSLSHHSGSEAAIEQLLKIDRWQMSLLAALLKRLEAVAEADGSTLLDNTLVYWSSSMSDGNVHDHSDIPVILAGGGANLIQGGRHLAFEETAMCDLFLNITGAFGVQDPTFGDDGTKPLSGL